MKRERRLSIIAVVLFIAAAGIAAGCAKRPAVAIVAAPAPTGAAVAPAPVAPVTPAPPAPAPPPPPPPMAARPEAPPPPPRAPERPADFASVPGLTEIHFDFDRSDVRAQDAKILDANATWLKTNPQAVLLIEGHCDERGTNEYNLALGERRAAAARDYLVSRGIDAGRINTVSYGEQRPECSDRNATCWARNRRARFLAKPR